MAIDSPLLRQLRQRELENLRIAARLKLKRLKIEAEIAEIESETEALRIETEAIRRETEAIRSETEELRNETEAIRSETWKLRAGNARLLSMLCDVVASRSMTADPMLTPPR